MLKRVKFKTENKKNDKKSGQSTVEYVLMFTAVIAVMFVILNDGGIFRTGLQAVYTDTMDRAQDHATVLFTSNEFINADTMQRLGL